MYVWRFPHTSIPLNHKTHLLTLSWHSWEGLPSGKEKKREECGGRNGQKGKQNTNRRVGGWWILTKYAKLSFDIPIPLWSTSTRTESVLSCSDLPVRHTSLRMEHHSERSVNKNTIWITQYSIQFWFNKDFNQAKLCVREIRSWRLNKDIIYLREWPLWANSSIPIGFTYWIK